MWIPWTELIKSWKPNGKTKVEYIVTNTLKGVKRFSAPFEVQNMGVENLVKLFPLSLTDNKLLYTYLSCAQQENI